MKAKTILSEIPRRTVDPDETVEAGFTLIELLVSLGVMTVVIIGALGLFDMNNKVARVQTQLAELQQYQRAAHQELARLIRMAGRGGIAFDRAIEIDNNVAANTPIVTGSTHTALAGTDVITVRGVFESEIYQVDSNNPTSFVYNPDGTGTVTIRSFGPTGVPQVLDHILETLADGSQSEALLLVSALDDSLYAVVELDPSQKPEPVVDNSTTPPTEVLTLSFKAKGGTHTTAYQGLHDSGINVLDGGQIGQVAYAGILEEYRFYVRDVPAQGNLANVTTMAPRLSMARVFPGTEVAYAGQSSNLAIDLADNVLDLQVAEGRDTDADGTIDEGDTASNQQNDEWRFNTTGDNAPLGGLSVIRISTLVRTDRPDERFRAPRVANLEDHDLSSHVYNTNSGERLFRRRALQTVVDLRNL